MSTKPTKYGWTAEMEANFRIMWERGDAFDAIVVALDRSSAAVRLRRSKMGLPPRKGGRTGKQFPSPTVGVVLSVSHSMISPQKLDKARALLAQRRDPHEVSLKAKLPLREVYRLAAELRAEARA
jgi:hypothetical protein